MGEIMWTMFPRFLADRTFSVIEHPEALDAFHLIAENTVTAARKHSHCCPVETCSAPRKHGFVFKLLNPSILCRNGLLQLPNPLVLLDNLLEEFSSVSAEKLHLVEAQLPSSWRVLLRPVINIDLTDLIGFTRTSMYHTRT